MLHEDECVRCPVCMQTAVCVTPSTCANLSEWVYVRVCLRDTWRTECVYTCVQLHGDVCKPRDQGANSWITGSSVRS